MAPVAVRGENDPQLGGTEQRFIAFGNEREELSSGFVAMKMTYLSIANWSSRAIPDLTGWLAVLWRFSIRRPLQHSGSRLSLLHSSHY